MDLSSLEFVPGWEEYFMRLGWQDQPLGTLKPGERPWVPNPYDMGKKEFLEFALRSQNALLAKGDKVLEELQHKADAAAAAEAVASAGKGAAAGQAGIGFGGSGGSAGADDAGQGSGRSSAAGTADGGGVGVGASPAGQADRAPTGHPTGAGASAAPVGRAATYVRPHLVNAAIDEWYAAAGVPPPNIASKAAPATPANAEGAANVAGGSAAGGYDHMNDAALQEALRKHWSVAPELLEGMIEEELADVEKFTAWGVACSNKQNPGQMPPNPDTQFDLYAGLEAAPPGAEPGTPEWLAWSERREKALVEKVERLCGL